jgi:hypothetical protein
MVYIVMLSLAQGKGRGRNWRWCTLKYCTGISQKIHEKTLNRIATFWVEI